MQTENGLQRAGDLQLLPKDFPLAREVQNTPDAEGKPPDLLYAEAHIDELASVSRPDKNGKIDIDADSRHGDFASNGWKYRTAFFRDFEGAYYEVRISTAIGDNGKVRIYNVGKMKNRAFPNFVGSSDLSGGARWGNDSVASRVSQTKTEVKQNMPDDQPLSRGKTIYVAVIANGDLIETESYKYYLNCRCLWISF